MFNIIGGKIMFEGMSEDEKVLFEEFLNRNKEENQMETKTNVAKKNSRFLKLLVSRLNRTRNLLDLIANLSVTSRYAYEREQVAIVIETLENRLAAIKVLFERGCERQEKRIEK